MSPPGMVTSKDIIEIAGISRATLNNYIKFGLLPRPVVGPPRPGDRGVKQIGYFPEEVLGRLEQVKSLKSQGRTMEEIIMQLGGTARPASPASPASPEALSPSPATPSPATSAGHASTEATVEADASAMRPAHGYSRSSDRPLRVTISDIDYPAYLINRNFEVEWINRQAEEVVFAKKVSSLVEIEARSIFRLFSERRAAMAADEWAGLSGLHLAVLRKNIDETVLAGLYRGISPQESALFLEIFRALPAPVQDTVFCLPLVLSTPGGARASYRVHTMTFREGTFFVYLPEDRPGDEIRELLSRRDLVINELLKRRMPSLVSLCVLVADLQDSVRISAELLPAQYFELINGLWECVGPSFEAHRALYGKHVGDGMLYYFLDRSGDNYIMNCINCAIELRESMKLFSRKWRGIKGWGNDLFLNIGINEGREFFGTIHSANTIEFTALGDTINIAARLSEFAADGEIWTTKHLVSRLSQEDRSGFSFGVHSKARPGNGFIRDSFARLGDLLTENNQHYRQLSAISGLPITEIRERVHGEGVV